MQDIHYIRKRIFRDPDFILLNVNAFLVVFGYGLAVYTGLASVEFMKIVKSFFLLLSIVMLFKDMRLSRNAIPSPSFIFILVFCFWIFLMSFFAEDIIFSISKSMSFILPFLYVYIALHNLLNKYPVLELLKAFLRSTNIIYALPVLSFLLAGVGFGNFNIYGYGGGEGQFFVSNQYGWACAVFIITAVDLWLNTDLSKRYRTLLIPTILLAFYLSLISGNRASWLSILLALMIFILRLKNIRSDFKVLIMIIPIVAIIWFYQIPESSLQTRLNDTEQQLESGEARFNTAKLALDKFNAHKSMWVTGAGMFNYDLVIHGEGLGDYHNSYFEVLFGGGVILFIMFLSFMVFRPIYNYTRYYSKQYLVIPPFLVIPLLESNLTGGQFVFFPWFIFMLLFNIPPERAESERKALIN